MLRLGALCVGLGLPDLAAPAAAETLELAARGAAAIGETAPRVTLRMEEGGAALLEGIIVPEALAHAVPEVLAPLLASPRLEVGESPVLDRYGRLLVQPRTGDGRWLQAVLVEAGLALVQPLPGLDDAVLARLLEHEAAAREAGRGAWRRSGDIVVAAEVDAARARLGHFALIEGRVLQASDQQRYFYLNFGDNWRTDVTARIDGAVLDAIEAMGQDPAEWEGRRVRVRGTLFEENGPMIELWSPYAIEVLP